jgi:hypothetical protein
LPRDRSNLAGVFAAASTEWGEFFMSHLVKWGFSVLSLLPRASSNSTPLAIYPNKPHAMITILSVDPSRYSLVLDQANSKFSSIPRVFITDNSDFRGLVAKQLLFEFIVPEETRKLAPAVAWHLYDVERGNFLIQKWRPVVIVEYGRTFFAPSHVGKIRELRHEV